MARLNITIPDRLQEQLERHRHSLNFSQICAQALGASVTEIEQELLKLESLRKEIGEMDQLIERMKEEKEGLLKERFEAGVERAKQWVRHASYKEACSWAETAEAVLPHLYSIIDPPSLPDGIIDEWDDLNDEDSDHPVPIDSDQITSFAEGFYTGLIEIWKVIDNKT